MFENIRGKEWGGGGAIGSNDHETPIHVTTHEGINDFLSDGCEFNDDGIPDPYIKLIPTSDTE